MTILFIGFLLLMVYHFYTTEILQNEINSLHEKLNEYDVMYDQIMMRGAIDLCDTKEWGYMWLSDSGLVWTESQPERCSSIYMSKDDFVNKWGKFKIGGEE